MPAIEMKEVVPEIVEYVCVACYETSFIKDFVEQRLAKLDITYEKLPDMVEDEKGVAWGVLCEGNSQQYGRHLAQFKVTRHKVMGEVLKHE